VCIILERLTLISDTFKTVSQNKACGLVAALSQRSKLRQKKMVNQATQNSPAKRQRVITERLKGSSRDEELLDTASNTTLRAKVAKTPSTPTPATSPPQYSNASRNARQQQDEIELPHESPTSSTFSVSLILLILFCSVEFFSAEASHGKKLVCVLI
jgi:hypothetical protein